MDPTPIGEILKQKALSPRPTSLTLQTTPTTYPFSTRGVPARYGHWRLADYDPRLVARVVDWAANDLWSLFLTGAPGTHKSSFAAAICAGMDGAYFATPETSIRMIREFCDWWILQAKTCRLLVMDDLASYRATPHVHDTLLSILACRYDNFRKTIITSNASLADIGKWLDLRLADRLREGMVLESGTTSRRPTGNEELKNV